LPFLDVRRKGLAKIFIYQNANGAKAFKSDLLCKFRCIAHASSERCYKDALAHLELWEVWNQPELKATWQWFENTWLKEHKVFEI